jgi:hypothetical protein
MKTSPEQRVTNRLKRKAPIMLLTTDSYAGYNNKSKAYYTPAVMYNYTTQGIYFESDYALQPGSDVHIKVEDQPKGRHIIGADKRYKAKVKWCKEIAESDPSRFGVGVQYA